MFEIPTVFRPVPCMLAMQHPTRSDIDDDEYPSDNHETHCCGRSVGAAGHGLPIRPNRIGRQRGLVGVAGEPATIGIGWYGPADGPTGSTYSGTTQSDVVAITNGPVNFDRLGGDDLICINDTGLAWGDGYPTSGVVCVDPALGNDTIHNNSSWHDPNRLLQINLSRGVGTDTYHGGPAREVTVANGGDWVSTAAGDDVVFASSGVAHVDCGDGDDIVVWASGPPEVVFNCETVTQWGADQAKPCVRSVLDQLGVRSGGPADRRGGVQPVRRPGVSALHKLTIGSWSLLRPEYESSNGWIDPLGNRQTGRWS
ncbi:MAG: hypothetical protein OEW42_14760 [Acidimicrobiia bacterium]|nr:hypothetical protein [Acidimicrobiia bacterium]